MLKQISDHVYYKSPEHYSDRPTICYIKGENLSALFDSGASIMHAKSIKEDILYASLKEPDYVILSHWHWDHSFGLSFWTKAKTIASRSTNLKLKELSLLSWKDEDIKKRVEEKTEIEFCYQKMKREYQDNTEKITVAIANQTFENTLKLNLGGIDIILEHVEGPHSQDSVICFIPSDKVILVSDSASRDFYSTSWHFDIEHEEDFEKNILEIPYDRKKVELYLKKLEKYDFQTVIMGHSEPCTKKEFLEIILDNLKDEKSL